MQKEAWIAFWTMMICVLLALVALFSAGLAITYRALPEGKFGDVATWMSAVFAGAAFVGTIRIAMRADKVRRQEQWDTAVVLSAAMLERISVALHTIQQIDEFMQMRIAELEFNVLAVTGGRKELTEWSKSIRNAIDECPKFDINELTGIAVLPNRAAAHIAAAMQRILLMRDDMTRASENRLNSNVIPHQYLSNQRRNIAACMLSLKIAQKECKRVVRDVSNDIAFHHSAGTRFD